MTLYVPLWVKSGDQSKDAEPSPLSVNMAPAGSERAKRAGMVLSASLLVRLKLRVAPSVVDLGPIVLKTGVWLPASLTVMLTTSLSTSEPSEA